MTAVKPGGYTETRDESFGSGKVEDDSTSAGNLNDTATDIHRSNGG